MSLVSVGFVCGARRGLRVHSCSRGFTRAILVVAGFIRVRAGSLLPAYVTQDSFASSGPTRVRRGFAVFGVNRFNVGLLGRTKGSPCSFEFAKVHSVARSGRKVPSGSCGLTMLCVVFARFFLVRVG